MLELRNVHKRYASVPAAGAAGGRGADESGAVFGRGFNEE